MLAYDEGVGVFGDRRIIALAVSVVLTAGLWLAPESAQAATKPTATALSRSTATVAGGTKVTIRGRHLNLVRSVLFGSTKATRITHVSTTKIVVTAPRHAAGTVRVWLHTKTRKYRTARTIRFTAPATTPSSYEAEVLRATNTARAHGRTCGSTVMPAAPPLSWNGKLGYAARAHSRDMAKRGYFSHTSKDGTGFATRITQTGYRWSALSENIAAGYSKPAAVVAAWLESPGHCLNLMSRSTTQLGVGYATGGPYGSYWTQDFGHPR